MRFSGRTDDRLLLVRRYQDIANRRRREFQCGKLYGSAAEPGSAAFPFALGVASWASTAHVPGASPVPGAPGPFAITKTPFTDVSLSPAELTSLANRCIAFLGNGSTYGICKSCRTGALGASRR